MPQDIFPADRACVTCAEPLSIYFDGQQCLRCKHSHKRYPMNKLMRRVQYGHRVNQQLETLPKFTEELDA